MECFSRDGWKNGTKKAKKPSYDWERRFLWARTRTLWHGLLEAVFVDIVVGVGCSCTLLVSFRSSCPVSRVPCDVSPVSHVYHVLTNNNFENLIPIPNVYNSSPPWRNTQKTGRLHMWDRLQHVTNLNSSTTHTTETLNTCAVLATNRSVCNICLVLNLCVMCRLVCIMFLHVSFVLLVLIFVLVVVLLHPEGFPRFQFAFPFPAVSYPTLYPNHCRTSWMDWRYLDDMRMTGQKQRTTTHYHTQHNIKRSTCFRTSSKYQLAVEKWECGLATNGENAH